jgi:hypothetical protein
MHFTGYLILYPNEGIILDSVSGLGIQIESGVFLSSNAGFNSVQDQNSLSLLGGGEIIGDSLSLHLGYDLPSRFGITFTDRNFWSHHDLLGSVGILDQVKHWSIFAAGSNTLWYPEVGSGSRLYDFTLNGKITHINNHSVPDAGSTAVFLGMAFVSLLGLRRLSNG